ncbi:MAG: limonene-1,2-epoxide hydrolase family protein [Acidimicrobiales bacterium]
MSPEELVNGFIAAVERGDIDGALGHLSDDCEYDNVPISKSIGHAAIRETLNMFIEPGKKTQFEIIRQAASGNVVMNERVDRLEVLGKPVEVPVAGVFEVEGDKITLWRDYFDLAGFNSQLS